MTFLCFLTILALAVKDCRRSLSKHLLLQLHLKHYKSVDVSLDRSITYWSKSTKIGKKVILRWMMTFWLSKEPVSQSHTHPAQPHQQEDQRPLPSLPYRATEKSLTLSQSYWYKCEAYTRGLCGSNVSLSMNVWILKCYLRKQHIFSTLPKGLVQHQGLHVIVSCLNLLSKCFFFISQNCLVRNCILLTWRSMLNVSVFIFACCQKCQGHSVRFSPICCSCLNECAYLQWSKDMQTV